MDVHLWLSFIYNVPIPIIGGDKLVLTVGTVGFFFIPFIFWIFWAGEAYYKEKVEIGLDNFIINDYYNMITITLKRDNFTWVLYKTRYRNLKVEDITSIKGTNYYTKDKKFLNYVLDTDWKPIKK